MTQLFRSWVIQEGELWKASRGLHKLLRKNSLCLENKTVIGLQTWASCFRRLRWGDGHGLSLMSTVKSHLSLNIPRAYGLSKNADFELLNCYG